MPKRDRHPNVIAVRRRNREGELNGETGFPMEMEHFPTGRISVSAHKPIAVAAGLGHMGLHRSDQPRRPV